MASATIAEPGTRERILFAVAELLRRQGYAATGLKQVTAEARAPFGSLYHFWPGGKEALAEEALRTGGAFFLALYRAIVDAEADVAAGVRAFFDGAGETLRATDFQDACPIATVAGEVASTNDVLRRATADAFRSWLDALAADLEAAGAPRDRARPVALAVVGGLEGAFLLCRALRSTDPMDAARDAALLLVTTTLEAP